MQTIMEKQHNGKKYNKITDCQLYRKLCAKLKLQSQFFGYRSAHSHTFQVLASTFLELMKHAFAEYVRNKEAPISLSHSVRVSVSRSVHVYTVYNVQLHAMYVWTASPNAGSFIFDGRKRGNPFYCLFGLELMQLNTVQCAPNWL